MSTTSTTTVKGAGLARGPALIVGSVLLAFSLLALITHNAFPSFGANLLDGDATGGKFLVFEVNGWTNWLLVSPAACCCSGPHSISWPRPCRSSSASC